MFKAYKYVVILKMQKHDFPAFMLFSHTNIQTSEGTFCCVEIQMLMCCFISCMLTYV